MTAMTTQAFQNGILFLGVIFAEDHLPPWFLEVVRQVFGPIAFVSGPVPDWRAPRSYEREMGGGLNHFIIRLDTPVPGGPGLADIKRRAMRIESQTGRRGNRRFNINPGIVTSTGMYLLSHKPSPIRRALAGDVWVEQQMAVTGTSLRPLANAFSEYVVGGRFGLMNQFLSETTRRVA